MATNDPTNTTNTSQTNETTPTSSSTSANSSQGQQLNDKQKVTQTLMAIRRYVNKGLSQGVQDGIVSQSDADAANKYFDKLIDKVNIQSPETITKKVDAVKDELAQAKTEITSYIQQAQKQLAAAKLIEEKELENLISDQDIDDVATYVVVLD